MLCRRWVSIMNIIMPFYQLPCPVTFYYLKKHFYSTKIILGIKELKTYNEKLCTVFVYLTFHILLLGLKSFIIILALEIIGA